MQQAIESDSIDEPGAAAAGACPCAAFGERYAAPILLSSRPGGETLRATDSQSGREVVVKLLPRGSFRPARMRLEHDAAVLRQVSSHWVSPLLDIAWAGDRLCLVRSFVSGGSLAVRFRGGRLDLADTLTVGRCLLSALKELHANGIMHRDVRPVHLVVGEEAPLAGAVLIDLAIWRGSRKATYPWTNKSPMRRVIVRRNRPARWISPSANRPISTPPESCFSSALPDIRPLRAKAWARSSDST